MTAFAWLVTVLVIFLLAAFVGYLVSLRRLPTATRTKVPIFDRFGHVKDVREPQQPTRK